MQIPFSHSLWMSRILQELREQNPFSRVFLLLFPSLFVHLYLRLFVIFLVSQLPFILVLVAGIHAEGHIHDKGSVLTRCSPAAESAWMFFAGICGLLATVADIYCVYQLISTRGRRSKHKRPTWPRRPTRVSRNVNPSSSTSCNSICVAGEAFELVSSNSIRMPPSERVSVFRKHFGDPEPDAAAVAPVHPNMLQKRIELLSPANGVLSDAGSLRLQLPTDPPTYHEAVLMRMQHVRPIPVEISRDGVSRPRIVRREAANPIAAPPVVPQPHEGGPPPRSRKPIYFNLRWRVCRFGLFGLCIVPLILSCFIQPLVRDSVYSHACDGYEWEIILDAGNGLRKSLSSNLPTAKFIERKANYDAKSFTMEVSLDVPIPMVGKPHPPKHRQGIVKVPVKDSAPQPPWKEEAYYNRFFYLKYSHKLLTQQLLSLISYNSTTHAYHGTFQQTPGAMSGEYTGSPHLEFPQLRLQQTVSTREDYFGFPRIVLEKDTGADRQEEVLVTSRVKRHSCTEMKVCVKGVKVAEAAVAVGPLLMGVVEAAGECRKGRT